MSGIAGITRPGENALVNQMLDLIAHRGPTGREMLDTKGVTFGLVWTEPQSEAPKIARKKHVVKDEAGAGHLAQAQAKSGGFILKRDETGVAPLYYGHDAQGALCFASEVKALLAATREVHELLPGHTYDGQHMQAYFTIEEQPAMEAPPEKVAHELRQHLEDSVTEYTQHKDVGAWLSGGLDSSTMAALARPRVPRLHTFAAGLRGAPDLKHAKTVADFIHSDHHEVTVSLEEMLSVLPEVIYHLESFDALLVRSSITNYMVAKRASDFVPAVFSGEGGDELFAGYDYLKNIEPSELPDELIDITQRLHNTALQRVDRSASAHGTVAHVGFLNPKVVNFALKIPANLKINKGLEKWVLRQAVSDILPKAIVNRSKAKFWEGAGVGDLLAQYAEESISDSDFDRERTLPNGWQLSSKEELMYYLIFREHFGEFGNLAWMGRTKGA